MNSRVKLFMHSVRNANSIDIASRTLLVEVDVDNPTGQLLRRLRLCSSQAA